MLIDALQVSKRNPPTHTKAQIPKLSASISEFRFLIPVLLDGQRRTLDGHARVDAAKRLHMTTVPTVRVDHLNDAQSA
ncbi:MAG: ParB N-terminal domain-containing protein [Devosia sp.]